MKGYTSREVAEMLGVTPAEVRAFARSGLVTVERGSRGEYRFDFHDLVMLRTARELRAANVPARRIRA
ncbi:MAG: helix-turn-helix domain-containing protein, partial [Thermoanaerobaculia bacterium]